MMLFKNRLVSGIGIFLLSLLVLSIVPVDASADSDLNVEVKPPKEKLAALGTTVQKTINISNDERMNDLTLTLIINRGEEAGRKWPANLENDSFKGVEPGEKLTTILNVTIPNEENDYAQNEIEVVLMDSQGENVTDVFTVISKPKSVYNMEYIATGVIFVIAAFVVVFARWGGVL